MKEKRKKKKDRQKNKSTKHDRLKWRNLIHVPTTQLERGFDDHNDDDDMRKDKKENGHSLE